MQISEQIKKNTVAVVIPYYHAELLDYEAVSYKQALKKLKNYPIILLVPDNMPKDKYPMDGQVKILQISSAWLQGISSYNCMMMNVEFYELFMEYEYILIYQLDALVIEDRLQEFCALEYDYIGAPWLHGIFERKHLEYGVQFVGNGGLSLRRVEACLRILKEQEIDVETWTEDFFWSCCNSETFRVAPLEVALSFAFETQVRKCYVRNRCRLPFGSHAWMKYDFEFWKEYLPEDNNPLKEIGGTYEQKDSQTVYNDKRFVKAPIQIIQHWIKWRKINRLYIFGSGIVSKIYSLPIANAKLNNYCYLDNNPARWGQKLYDGDIVSPEILLQEPDEHKLIIVAIKEYQEVYMQLEAMGINTQEEVITYLDFAKEINTIWG